VHQVHDAGGGSHLVEDVRRGPGVREQDRRVLNQDVGVDRPGAAHRAEVARVAAVVDPHEPGEAALDQLLVDDVGRLQAYLRPGPGVVVDLDRHGRPVDVDGTGFDAGERAADRFGWRRG
jgi:hypothetical protein